MARFEYYPKITLKDEEENEYEFRSYLETLPVRRLRTSVSKNSHPYGERDWGKIVPMVGQVRNFAERFLADSRYRSRWLLPSETQSREKPGADKDKSLD